MWGVVGKRLTLNCVGGSIPSQLTKFKIIKMEASYLPELEAIGFKRKVGTKKISYKDITGEIFDKYIFFKYCGKSLPIGSSMDQLKNLLRGLYEWEEPTPAETKAQSRKFRIELEVELRTIDAGFMLALDAIRTLPYAPLVESGFELSSADGLGVKLVVFEFKRIADYLDFSGKFNEMLKL